MSHICHHSTTEERRSKKKNYAKKTSHIQIMFSSPSFSVVLFINLIRCVCVFCIFAPFSENNRTTTGSEKEKNGDYNDNDDYISGTKTQFTRWLFSLCIGVDDSKNDD